MRKSISQAILEFLNKNPELSTFFAIKDENQQSLFTQQINFLNDLYEKNEEFKRLITEQMPKMLSLADIASHIASLSGAAPQSSQGQTISFLKGMNAAELANRFDDRSHLVVQVASQANANESRSPDNATAPEFYASDPTQGPRAQMQDPILAFVRFKQIEHCDFLKNWKEKTEFNECFEYQHGYLHPTEGKEKEAADFIKNNIDTLLVNADLMMPDYQNSQSLATQVLNFAMALGGYDYNFKTNDEIIRTPEAMEHVKNAAMRLLKQQYLMTAHMAILRAQEYPQKRIPVVFTLVGGGVFGNDKKWIAEAITAAHLVIEKSALPNIDTVISCYSENELSIMRALFVYSSFSKAKIIPQDQLQPSKTISDILKPLPKPTELTLQDFVSIASEKLSVAGVEQIFYCGNMWHNSETQVAIAESQNTSSEFLDYIVSKLEQTANNPHKSGATQIAQTLIAALAKNPNITEKMLGCMLDLMFDPHKRSLNPLKNGETKGIVAIAKSSKATPALLERIVTEYIGRFGAGERLYNDEILLILTAVTENPKATPELLEKIKNSDFYRVTENPRDGFEPFPIRETDFEPSKAIQDRFVSSKIAKVRGKFESVPAIPHDTKNPDAATGFESRGRELSPHVSKIAESAPITNNFIPEDIAIAFYKQLYRLKGGSAWKANDIFNSESIPTIVNALEKSKNPSGASSAVLVAIKNKSLGELDPFVLCDRTPQPASAHHSFNLSRFFSSDKSKTPSYKLVNEKKGHNYVVGVEIKDNGMVILHGINAKGEYRFVKISGDKAISYTGAEQDLSSLRVDPGNGFSVVPYEMLVNRDAILKHFGVEPLPAPAPTVTPPTPKA